MHVAANTLTATNTLGQVVDTAMLKSAITIVFVTFATTVSSDATTCSEAVARCKIAGASKPHIEISCEEAGAACMKTGRFRGPVTNTSWPDHLIRR